MTSLRLFILLVLRAIADSLSAWLFGIAPTAQAKEDARADDDVVAAFERCNAPGSLAPLAGWS